MAGQRSTSKPDSNPLDLLAHIQRLERAGTPAATAVLHRIEAGARNLADERAAAKREGLPIFPAQLQASLPLPNQTAAPIYTRLTAIHRHLAQRCRWTSSIRASLR